MGLGFSTDASSDSSSGSSSSSSSSTSSNTKEKVPYCAVYEDPDDGKLKYRTHPQNLFITIEDGDMIIPEEMERFWMTKQSFWGMSDKVKSHIGTDLMTLLQRDPHKALRAIRDTARNYESDNNPGAGKRTCVICDKSHHTQLGDYSEVGDQKKAVCDRHSVEDLRNHDLL